MKILFFLFFSAIFAIDRSWDEKLLYSASFGRVDVATATLKSKKIKNDNLQSEHNYSVLYPHKKVLVVQDESPDPEFKKYFYSVSKIFGTIIDEIEFSKLEDNDSLDKYSLVRWLSIEPAPEWIYKYDFSLDTNKIVQNSQRELFSWVREQSISITNHRYGNIGFSPVSIETS